MFPVGAFACSHGLNGQITEVFEALKNHCLPCWHRGGVRDVVLLSAAQSGPYPHCQAWTSCAFAGSIHRNGIARHNKHRLGYSRECDDPVRGH